MKKLAFAFFALFFSVLSYAQIEGKWKTIDDEKPENNNCVKCTDDRKNKPLVGLEIIRGLKKDGSEFTDGTITDPKKGKTYNCTVTRSGDKLNVRGYVGISLIGRNQTWHRVD